MSCCGSAIIALVITILGPAAARAQENAKDHVEPRLSRPQFTLFVRQLGLDSDQRSIAELMFSDYAGALDSLTAELEQQAMGAGLRTVQDAMTGKTRIPADELRASRVAVLKIYQQAGPSVDKALDDLVFGVESVLTETQAPHFAQAVRELHRNLLLHPRQASRDFQEYAGEGVDVLLLAENAKAQSGELHALAPDAIHNVLAEYERELDALLLRQAAAHRDGKLARKIATIEKDTAAIRDLDQAALTRWKELYQLNLRAVRQIGDIAASSLGEDARRKWLDRFDQASFTWLYPRRRPDRQIDWIRQQSLPADPREQAEATYENYLNRRRELSRQAIDIMLRARLEFQTMVYSMMDPASIDDGASRGLYEELLKNSGEQANLDSITAAALETLLNSTQREAMRKALQGPDPASRR